MKVVLGGLSVDIPPDQKEDVYNSLYKENFLHSLYCSLLLIVMVVGLLAILFYNNLYAMNVVRNGVVQSYRDLLPRYVDKQDDNLSDIQDHLIREEDFVVHQLF